MKEPLSSNLSADVFKTLKERIIRWEYPPGHRLTEEELCEEFQVSRSPVREALRVLAENNLIDKIPHRGYRVKQPDINEIGELYDVRLALELFLVERLAERNMLKDEWHKLHHTWTALLENLPNVDVDPAYEDRMFHEALAEATGNETLKQLLRTINERLHFIRMTDFATEERLRQTCVQHLQILEYIIDGDADGACEAMRRNIDGGRDNVETAVKEALARAYMS